MRLTCFARCWDASYHRESSTNFRRDVVYSTCDQPAIEMPRDLIGETLLNQFRIETFIASGGMATIYRVWDTQRSVPLAMKVLHPELAADPTFIARFEREAESLRRLVHPNIVPFYGLFHAGDITFLLERYIDGPSLDEMLRARAGQPLPLGEALVFFKALYTSLGYAHAQGIIHCDVKPGNVLIDQGGHVYLTDFGIARFMDSSTTTSSALGTPLYMAPEQIRGERVTPQSDVYSLGVVMFELLTGQRPFRGEGDIPEGVGSSPSDRIRYQHLYQPPPDPRWINPDLPEGVARIILRAMAKNPQDRYPSVLAMADDISALVSARFETIPDRIRLPENLRTDYDWAPAEPAPQPNAGSFNWPWDAAAGRDGAPDPDYDQPQAGWDDAPMPQATHPGPAAGPAGTRTLAPSRLPIRLLAILASLVLMGLCIFFGARWISQAAAGVFAGQTPGSQPGPTQTLAPGEPSPTPDSPGVMTATVPEPAVTRPAAPPDLTNFPVNGEIAIVQMSNGVDRLHLLNAGSGESTQMPPVPGVDANLYYSPQWSPDGQKLAWVSRYNGRLHVVAMDMNEREPYQLPAGEAYQRVSSPAWTPDGQRVTFWASGGDGSYLVSADGITGEEVDRVDLPVYRNLFVWNWQTGLVAFVQQLDGQFGTVVSSSPERTELSIDTGGEEYAPAWSNDGQWLAFQSDAGRDPGMNEIWISRQDGTGLRQVTVTPEEFWSRAPTWSPDGRMIAFVSNRSSSIGNDYGELFVVDLETGQIRQMTNTGGQVYDWRPAWRP